MIKVKSKSQKSFLLAAFSGLAIVVLTIGVWTMQESPSFVSETKLMGTSQNLIDSSKFDGKIIVMPKDISGFVSQFGSATAAALNRREIDLFAVPVVTLRSSRELWVGNSLGEHIIVRFSDSAKGTLQDIDSNALVNIRGIVRTTNAGASSVTESPTPYIQASEWEITDGRSNYQM